MEKVGIEYFTSNPQGHLMEKHIKNNFPDFYEYITNNYSDELKFTEKLYWYYHNIHEKPTCCECHKNTTRFISFFEGYAQFCSSKCVRTSSSLHKKMKDTILKKYGVENVSQSQEIKEKKKQTLKEHYGVNNVYEIPGMKDQIKNTILKKYGVKNALQSQKIKEKIKQTNLKKYGVENPFSSQEIKEKIKQTNLEKYGVEHASQSPVIKDKVKQTNLERYGITNTFNLSKSQTTAKQSIWNKTKQNNKDIIDILIDQEGNIIYKCSCPHKKCNKCNDKTYTIISQIFNNRKQKQSELCTKLLPIDNSHNSGGTLELFVRNILDTYNIPYIENDRKILKGKELDIYIPEKKIGIECNGVYWHSLKEPSYHFDKWKECKDQDIQLITIWEDQIYNKPKIIEGIIKSHLGIYEHQIGARKCILKEVSSKESNKFLEENHLQGKVNGSIRLGLYYNNELVSLMVFGAKRRALGNKNDKETYELYRYCNKLGWQIQGGASRLFKYFIDSHNGSIVESFSSNDISIGALYKNLKFQLVGTQNGSYWYITKDMQRYHRYSFRKDVLVKEGHDPNKTEFEITNEIGLIRIYDSGQQKWIYKQY